LRISEKNSWPGTTEENSYCPLPGEDESNALKKRKKVGVSPERYEEKRVEKGAINKKGVSNLTRLKTLGCK